MTRMPAKTLRAELAEALNRVAYGGERIVIERRGRGVAVLVSVRDAALIEQLEDQIDIREARKAVAQARRKGEKPIPLVRVKKELGL